MNDADARTGAGRLSDDWAAKAVYLRRSDPLWRRPGWRRAALVVSCVAGLAATLASRAFDRWRDDEIAELARQRHCLQAFLHSAEFADFVRSADAQLAALNNFVAARPRATDRLLPDVAAGEAARGEIGWTFDVMPLPVSAAQVPARVYRAQSRMLALLAHRGWQWDEAAQRRARGHFVRLLAPAANAFLHRSPENAFPALTLDRSMQEAALAAFAQRHGPTASTPRTERMFWLHATFGAEMKRAVQADLVRRGLANGSGD